MSVGAPISPREFMSSGASGIQIQYASKLEYKTQVGYNPSSMYTGRRASAGYEVDRRE